MSNEELILQLLRDRFDKVDQDNANIVSALEKHADKDAVYWKKIDEQRAQLRVIKGLVGSSSLAALIAWLYQKFHS